MKEGWERRKIKEVADVVGGSTPKTNVEDYWGGDCYWVTPAELNGSKYIDKTVRRISSKAVEKTNLTLMPSGTVLLSSRAPIGKVCITKAPMYCNQGFKNLVCKELLYNEFAYYYLKHNVDFLQSLGTGATFKEISKKVVENVTIPIPPLSEQQHIVEELDLLCSIIEKKKAQLNELDKLAQSLFYEMFGDPIANEKGWEKCKLEDVCDVRDGTHDSPKYVVESDYVLITSKNIQDGEVSFENVNYITKEDYDKINMRSYVDDGDIIMAMIGTIGKPIIVKKEGRKFCIKNVALIKFKNSNCIINTYVKAMLDNPTYMDYVHSLNRGGTQKFVSLKTIRNLSVLLPSMDLQQQFASKIEAIERQKDLIKQSIKEVETLFNSRMDYYFS